jgi:hypothetical protein
MQSSGARPTVAIKVHPQHQESAVLIDTTTSA